MTQVVAEANISEIQRVANEVKDLIRERHIGANGMLPNYHELCTELGTSYVTVNRGMALLAAEGLVRSVRGKGTFVTKDVTRQRRELDHLGLIYPAGRHHLFTDSYLTEIMRGITQAAPPRSDMHIFSMREEGLVDAAQLGEWAVDGAILIGMENDDYLRAFASWGTPGVVVDYCPRDVPLDYVACDNTAAASRMVEYLAALGHRRVAFVAPHPQYSVLNPRNIQATLMTRESSDVRERREDCIRALRERDMLAAEFCPTESDRDWHVHAAQAAAEWMRLSDRPTALLTACGDDTAVQLLRELERCGIRVPADLSVCSVSGATTFERRENPVITCCNFDFVGMGRMAVELLVKRCRQPASREFGGHRIGFKFVEGETVRTLSKT